VNRFVQSGNYLLKVVNPAATAIIIIAIVVVVVTGWT
jgi:hypothetical protein